MKKSLSKAPARLFSLVAIVALAAVLYLTLGGTLADETSQTAGVNNAQPTVDSLITTETSGGSDTDTVTLTENSVTTVYFSGTASDDNGCEDINDPTLWTYVAYRTDVANAHECTADMNDCYQGHPDNMTITACDGGGDLSLDFEGSVDLEYYADATDAFAPTHSATDWTVKLFVRDETSNEEGELADTYEVESLRALDLSGPVNYGNLTLGEDSEMQTITVTQTGNQTFDVDVSMPDMECDGAGSEDIPATQLHISTDDEFVYGTDDQAVTNDAAGFDLNMTVREDDLTPLTSNIYAILRLPDTGLRGTCDAIMTITAVEDAS